MLSSGPLGLLVVLGGYLAAVAIDLARPARWREANKWVRNEAPSLPPAALFTADSARDAVLRLERARADRASALLGLPPATRDGCETLLQKTGALEEAAVRILPVLDRVSSHLRVDPTESLRLEVVRLERATAAAAVEAVRRDYAQAFAVLGERVRLLEQAEQLKTLLLARLEVILSELEAVAPGLMGLELQQSAAAVLDSPSSGGGLIQELQTMQEAAASVLSRRPEPATDAPVSAFCWTSSPVWNHL
jgi:hypothetical protein